MISLIRAAKDSCIDFFQEFDYCRFAQIGHALDSAIIKKIGYYNSNGEILRFASFLIAFLKAIINCSRFR